MGVVEQSSGAVESQLSELEDCYGSFSINQRTIDVPTAQYEQKRERSGSEQIELHAKICNGESQVLHVNANGNRILPFTTESIGAKLESALREAVADRTGVQCQVDELVGVTILGIRDGDEPDRETIYQLAALFEGQPASGSLSDSALWKEYEPDSQPVYL